MRLWMLSKAVFQHAYNKVSHDFFLTKEMIGVKNKQWIYKVGGRPQGLILSLFVFFLFGGMTFYFYLQINRHGAFLFGFLLAILVLFLIFFSVFRGLFIKVLIAEDGFYPGRLKAVVKVVLHQQIGGGDDDGPHLVQGGDDEPELIVTL